MGTSFTVFLKEVLDNFRDRRTLGSALLMGPIFGPVLFAFVINLSIERSLESAETTLELPVIGSSMHPTSCRSCAAETSTRSRALPMRQRQWRP